MRQQAAVTVVLAVTVAAGVGLASAAPNATIEHEGEELTLESAPDQRITGSTSLDPGETVTVRVRSSGESPFLESHEVSVEDGGTFVATLDLSHVEPGTSFEAFVIYNGSRLAEADGTVGACVTECAATETRTGPPESGIGLEKSVILTRRGQTGKLPFAMDDAEALSFSVGSPDVNYEIEATIRDRDGDGRVIVLFNTANAGQQARTLTVVGDDAVNVAKTEPTLESELDPGDYDVNVYRGADASGEQVDVGTLVVDSPDRRPTTNDGSNGQDSGDTTGMATPGSAVTDRTASLAIHNGSTGALGAIVLASVLAVAGIGVMLGVGRN